MATPGECTTPKRLNRHAFSLIELLVVIAIVALLMSVLLPSLSRARRLAKWTLCNSQLRQMSIAVGFYASDNNDVAPPVDHRPYNYWFHKIAKYLGDEEYERRPHGRHTGPMGIMICPETQLTNTGKPRALHSWSFMGGRGSYGMNLWLDPNGLYQRQFKPEKYHRKFHTTSHTTLVPVFADSFWVGGWPDDFDIAPNNLWLGHSHHRKGMFMGRFCINRHDMAINVTFADGTARRVPLAELWKLKWHRQFQPSVKQLN